MKSRIDTFLYRAFVDANSRTYHIVNDTLAVITMAAVAIVVLESIESFSAAYETFFLVSEIIVLAIFTVEYALYIYITPKKSSYVFSSFGIIDLLSILPTYLSFLFFPLFDFRSLRVLRVLRVLRLLRLFRLLKLIGYMRRHPGERVRFAELPWYNIEIYFFALLSVVVIAGTLMFLAEFRAEGSYFTSIPVGMWWAIVTITTVGYGDIVPQTVLGRTIAAFTMLAGLMLFALLVSVMGKVTQKVLFGTPLEVTNKDGQGTRGV